MVFYYMPTAGDEKIEITGTDYHYLFQVRRSKKGSLMAVQNMNTQTQFIYEIFDIQKRSAQLVLKKSISLSPQNSTLHIGWGKCDAKTVYKTLPFLNELGVEKITFLTCQRSQGNISYSKEKLQSLCISSSQQCGRNSFIEFDEMNLHTFLEQYPNSVVCDIPKGKQDEKGISSLNIKNDQPFIIGPEGGFTEDEKNDFSHFPHLSFPGNVLRSETACIKVASFYL